MTSPEHRPGNDRLAQNNGDRPIDKAASAPHTAVPQFLRTTRMAITRLILAQNGHERQEDPETARANAFIERYLRENTVASATLEGMKDIIAEFKKRTPRIMKSKCIDGRVHGSKAIGYPPGTVTFSRSEGNKVDLSPSNTVFWSRLNRVVLDAKRHTPNCPAVFITLGHRSSQGHGCAAHGLDDAKALAEVQKQASDIRTIYKQSELYVIHGMTNTDDMSERLIFADGTELDTESLIATLGLQHPTDVFAPTFLDTELDDGAADRYVGHRTPRELLQGTEAPVFHDLQTALAMESYLVREIGRLHKDGAPNAVLDARVLRTVKDTVDGIRDLPPALKGPLLYQCVWNITYTLHKRERLAHMDAQERDGYLDHAEELVCYGDGFDLLTRNKAVLVKTGRGNDEEALRVAHKVLTNNRHLRAQPHPPIVHINVEVSGGLTNWDAFNDQVLSRIKTMLMPVYGVFGQDVRVLSTYSYKDTKQFFPVRLDPDSDGKHEPEDARESFPIDITRRLTDENFKAPELERRENAYSMAMLADGEKA